MLPCENINWVMPKCLEVCPHNMNIKEFEKKKK